MLIYLSIHQNSMNLDTLGFVWKKTQMINLLQCSLKEQRNIKLWYCSCQSKWKHSPQSWWGNATTPSLHPGIGDLLQNTCYYLFFSRTLSCATTQKISLICSSLVIYLVYSHWDRPHEPGLYLDHWKYLCSIRSEASIEVPFMNIEVDLRCMDCAFRAS